MPKPLPSTVAKMADKSINQTGLPSSSTNKDEAKSAQTSINQTENSPIDEGDTNKQSNRNQSFNQTEYPYRL